MNRLNRMVAAARHSAAWLLATAGPPGSSAWLRPRSPSALLYRVQNLSSDLKALPVIAYSHELTGSVDVQVFHAVIIIFPLIALMLTAFVAVARGDAAAARATHGEAAALRAPSLRRIRQMATIRPSNLTRRLRIEATHQL
jgi:hypothetical protein